MRDALRQRTQTAAGPQIATVGCHHRPLAARRQPFRRLAVSMAEGALAFAAVEHSHHQGAQSWLCLVCRCNDLGNIRRLQRIGQTHIGNHRKADRLKLQCTATITSGTVDMPTTSAPIARKKRYWAVFQIRTGDGYEDTLVSHDVISPAIAKASSTSFRSYGDHMSGNAAPGRRR